MIRDILKNNNMDDKVFNGNFVICGVTNVSLGDGVKYDFRSSDYDDYRITHRINTEMSDLDVYDRSEKERKNRNSGLSLEQVLEEDLRLGRLKSRMKNRSKEKSLCVRMIGYKGEINFNNVENTINILMEHTDFFKSNKEHVIIKQRIILVSGAYNSKELINDEHLHVYRMSIFDFITCRGFYDMLGRRSYIEKKVKDKKDMKSFNFFNFLLSNYYKEDINFIQMKHINFELKKDWEIYLNILTDDLFNIIKTDIKNFVFIFEDMDRPLINILFTIFLNTQISGGSGNRRHVYNSVDDVLGMFLKLNSKMKFNGQDVVELRNDESVLNNLQFSTKKGSVELKKYSVEKLWNILDNSVYHFNSNKNLQKKYMNGIKCIEMKKNDYIKNMPSYDYLSIYSKSKNICNIVNYGLLLI